MISVSPIHMKYTKTKQNNGKIQKYLEESVLVSSKSTLALILLTKKTIIHIPFFSCWSSFLFCFETFCEWKKKFWDNNTILESDRYPKDSRAKRYAVIGTADNIIAWLSLWLKTWLPAWHVPAWVTIYALHAIAWKQL